MSESDPAPEPAHLEEILAVAKRSEVSAFYAALRVARDAGIVKLRTPPDLHAACLAAAQLLKQIADALPS